MSGYTYKQESTHCKNDSKSKSESVNIANVANTVKTIDHNSRPGRLEL